jgi:hypothetical protein
MQNLIERERRWLAIGAATWAANEEFPKAFDRRFLAVRLPGSIARTPQISVRKAALATGPDEFKTFVQIVSKLLALQQHLYWP